MHTDVHPVHVRGLRHRMLRLDRDHRKRAFLVDGNERHHRKFLRAADLQRRQIGEAEIGIAVRDELQCVGRSGAFADRRDVDPRFREVAVVARNEEHRMVAAHQPIELHRDIVRGLRDADAGPHRSTDDCRAQNRDPFASVHDSPSLWLNNDLDQPLPVDGRADVVHAASGIQTM